MKKNYLKIFLAIATAVVMMLAVCVLASAETVSPDLRIAYCNLAFENDTHIMYAVKSNDANVKLLVWDAPQSEYTLGTQTATVDPLADQMDINGEMYTIFKYTGLAAKQMTDDVYVRACIDNGGAVTYGEVHKYSILQYSYNKLGKTGIATENDKLIKMLNSLLEYGAAAQELYGYNTDRLADDDFYQVKVNGTTLPDGFKSGLYLEGETIALSVPEQNAESVLFTRWRDIDGYIISSSADYTLTVGNTNNTYTPEYLAPTEGLEYTLINNGTEYALTSMGEAWGVEDVIIAKVYDNKPVTAIADNAFRYEDSITHVTIPDSVTTIGAEAFEGGDALVSVNVPNKVTSIGMAAFSGCMITRMELPDSLMTIGNNAFSSCVSLTRINIPDGVSVIGESVFIACESLTGIKIPDSVTSIGEYAFGHCSNMESVNFGESSLLENIAEYAFYGCSSLTSISFGGNTSLTNIPAYAFSRCSGLRSIAIPAGVTTIDDRAFYNCGALESITVASGNTAYKSIDNCLINIADSELILGCKNSIIPSDGSVTGIYHNAFSGSGITEINIPSTVTWIGGAFDDCSELESITVDSGNTVYKSIDNCLIEIETNTLIAGCKNSVIPNDGSVTIIDREAFAGCSGLTGINIPNTIIEIGYGAFMETGLTSVIIPSSVTTIDSEAFRGCSELATITVDESNTAFASHDGILYNKEETEIIYVPEAITGDVSIPNGVTTIAERMFSDRYELTSLSIPESVTTIEWRAFFGCENLSSVTFGENSLLSSIGERAFYSCKNLVSINIPASVSTIGNEVFFDCSNLTTITFGENSLLSSIGERAFYICENLVSINIPASVSTIGNEVFFDCSNLTTITFGENSLLSSIPMFAFYNCNKLESIIIPEGVSAIGEQAFYACRKLKSMTIPSSVTSIGAQAFLGGGNGSFTIYYSGTSTQWEAIEKGSRWNGLTHITIQYS